MKKYVFTIQLQSELPIGTELVPIVAKNLQSALAKLCQGAFYSEDQVTNVTIIKS